MTIVKEEVRQLLAALSSTIEIPGGAAKDEIDELSEYYVDVPGELEEWLSLCNAPVAGEIFLGVKPVPPFRLIESVYETLPDWEDYEWIPVANDGCGNYYVMDASEKIGATHPVYFIDHEVTYDRPCYIVASGLWAFVRFALEKELTKDRRFPFDKSYVLEKDPNLKSYKGDVPFPWQT